MTRFRDTITGLFTSARKAARNEHTTVAETLLVGHGLSRINRRILLNALEDEQQQTSSVSANAVMRDAIRRVLG